MSQNKTHLLYTVQGQLKDSVNYDNILSEYLRLSVPLQEHYKKWAAVDTNFQKCLDENNAVRILKQDTIETLFSFICSSNNNITRYTCIVYIHIYICVEHIDKQICLLSNMLLFYRISNMVEKLCSLFGQKICSVDNKEYYDFPTIESLKKKNIENVLKREKFGYRAGYIVNTAERLSVLGGKNWLLSLQKENNIPYHTAREQLMTLPGIGPKVADCICLMSLGYLEAVPIDTHIFQIARTNYLPHLKEQKTVTPKIHTEINAYLRELWGPLAGWAQAIIFSTKINVKSESNGKRKHMKDTNSVFKKVSKKK